MALRPSLPISPLFCNSLQVDCGYVGINQQICQTKGCCWNPSSSQGVPWCYYPAGATTTCFRYNPSLSTPFSDAEVAEMRGYMMANINIQGKGGIVAAPGASGQICGVGVSLMAPPLRSCLSAPALSSPLSLLDRWS